MKTEASNDETDSDERIARRPSIETFYTQPFASQMILWATRRRLLERAGVSDGSDDVRHVFAMAGWVEFHVALLRVVDAMFSWSRLPAHQISCPTLARHERSLINTLACLQRRDVAAARAHLGDILPPGIAPAALNDLESIATGILAHGLRFNRVAPIGAPVWLSPASIPERNHVH